MTYKSYFFEYCSFLELFEEFVWGVFYHVNVESDT